MATHSKLFLNTLAVFLGLALCGTPPAHALVIVHSEVNVSGLTISAPSGSILWTYDPWLATAGASAFDDPSGFSQSYDDNYSVNPGADGALASATTAYVSSTAIVSAANGTIDVVTDLNNPTGNDFALNGTGFGDLYNEFLFTGTDPLDVIFSIDWSAQLSGNASPGQSYSLDYGIQLLIADSALQSWQDNAFNVLTGTGQQSLPPDQGTLSVQLTLLPGVLYSIDISADSNPRNNTVPEPSMLELLASGGLLASLVRKRRTKKGACDHASGCQCSNDFSSRSFQTAGAQS